MGKVTEFVELDKKVRLGIYNVVGADEAIERIPTGQEVTINCAEGNAGRVYEGILPFHVDSLSLKDLRRPKIKIMMNLGNPEQALSHSNIPPNPVVVRMSDFKTNEYAHLIGALLRAGRRESYDRFSWCLSSL